MAEIFPDEWLDHLLGQEPRADTATYPIVSTMYMGLFTAQTSSTVPPRTTTLASPGTNVNEPTGTNYARVTMAAAVWGAQGTITTSGSGRRLTASQQSFAESGAGGWNVSGATIKGFFLATASSAGKGIYFANFDDGQAIDVNALGYTIRVTPYYQYDG